MRLRHAPTQYEAKSRIAVGGMAEVWRAEAIFENGERHPVAIKRVLPNKADTTFRAMFEDEARLGMQLRHPNIVRVYDARDIGGTYIMIMELVDGDTLKGVLDGAHARKACMPLPMALHIGRELCKALDYAHYATNQKGKPLGIIHRDVSPHNLLLGKDGAVKLSDFGLADASMHESLRDEDLVGGKLGYLAPEVIQQLPPDHRIDIFAVGILLWEMLAGRRLFQGASDRETLMNVARCDIPSLRELNPRVGADLEVVVRKLLSRNRETRFADARAASRALEGLIEEFDGEASADDVSLVVGMHLANRPKPREDRPLAVADLLAHELRAFAEAAQGTVVDMGAEPLDPGEFDVGGLRRMRRARGKG